MERKTTVKYKIPLAFRDYLLMPKDPLNPPTVSTYFSDLLPT